MSNLTDAQKSKVDMVKEICHKTEDECVRMLTECGWNAENAVNALLSGVTPGQSNGTGGGPGAGRPAAPSRAVQQPQPERLIADQGLGLPLPAPLNLLFDVIWSFFKSVGGAVWQCLSLFLGGGPDSGWLRPRFVEKYGEPCPEFVDLSFSEAVKRARTQHKLFVIYLHDDNNAGTDGFVHNFLQHNLVLDILKEHFVVWGGDMHFRESARVAASLKVRRFPYMAVLVPTGVGSIRALGQVNPAAGLDRAIAFLTQMAEETSRHREEMNRTVETDRNLMAEQNAEYEAALAADRALEESKLQAEEAAIREAQERKQKAEEAAAKAQNVAQIRENLAKELPAKLEAALAGQDQVARIVVRVPSGQRFEQKFPHNAKLELLEEWASCLKFLPSSHSPEDVEVPDKFVLCMSFPNKELVETDQTMEELKLTPSCLLCMKSLDHD